MILGSVILTGGPSTRMGTPKESLAWGDASLLLHTVTTLLNCSFPVVVLARSEDQELPPLHTECELAFDEQPGDGPLTAMLTGLKNLQEYGSDHGFLCSCDLPFLTERSVGFLAEQFAEGVRGVVPEVDGQAQPLYGIYSTALIPEIEALVQKGERRAQAICDLPGVQKIGADTLKEIDPELNYLRDVDTPEAYQKALSDAGLPADPPKDA